MFEWTVYRVAKQEVKEHVVEDGAKAGDQIASQVLSCTAGTDLARLHVVHSLLAYLYKGAHNTAAAARHGVCLLYLAACLHMLTIRDRVRKRS